MMSTIMVMKMCVITLVVSTNAAASSLGSKGKSVVNSASPEHCIYGQVIRVTVQVTVQLFLCTCSFAASLLIGSPTGNSEVSGVKVCEPLDSGLTRMAEADLFEGVQCPSIQLK